MLGQLTVTYEDDTTVDVVSKNVDVIAFERKFRRPAAKMWDDEGNMFTEALWWFAYCGVKRADAEETRDFDQWCEAVTGVKVTAPKGKSTRSRSSSK